MPPTPTNPRDTPSRLEVPPRAADQPLPPPPPPPPPYYAPTQPPVVVTTITPNEPDTNNAPAVAHPPAQDSAAQPSKIPDQPKRTTPSFKRSPLQIIRPFIGFFSFVATVAIAAALLNAFVFQSYYVQGSSMTPTLHDRDRLIVSKVEKTAARVTGKTYIPERGQIVVIDSSVSELTQSQNEQIIKRVVGIPGDTITIKDGIVTVKNSKNQNGFDVNKELNLQLEPTYFENADSTTTVPDGSVFVLGDNRVLGGSYDSRYFGVVSSDKIIGRLWIRIFPFDDVESF